MKIWLISIAEQTAVDNAESTRFLCIADEAINRGHDVTFFASTFKHNTKTQRFEELTVVDHSDHYRTKFIPSLFYTKNLSIRRMYSHWKYSNDLVNLLESEIKPDIVYLGFPPISLAFTVSKFCNKYKIPFVIDIIDPWPDTFRKAIPGPRFISSVLLWPLYSKVKSIFNENNYVTGISNQYIQWAQTLGKNPKILRCFYPAVNYKNIDDRISEIKQNLESDNKFYVIYAGSLAVSYDIKCILDAAVILGQEYGDKIYFYIAGAGPQDLLIKEYEQKNNNIKFLGRLTKPDLMQIYAKCHLGTTQHIKGATQSVTYKLFDLLASGLPILNSLESEMKDIIVNNKVGLHNDPGDARILAKNIQYFYDNKSIYEEFRQNGYALTKKLGDAPKVYAELVATLEEIKG